MSEVFAGLDWASRSHAVCVIDERAVVRLQWEATHDAAGLAELMRRGLAASEQSNRIGEAAAVYALHPLTGLPVVASRQPVTEDDVKALDDDP